VSPLTIVPVPANGTEDVLVATHGPHEGAVFTGTEDGTIWRVRPEGGQADAVANTGGRPLGIELHPDGWLLVCDSHRGLLRVDVAAGTVDVVADALDGIKMLFCNNAAIATDGTAWFSDSSRSYGLDTWRSDIVMATRSGRLVRRDPDGTVTTVLDGLDFANGVALSADGSFVAVAESGACTIVRHWLSGDLTGTRDYLVPRLPGYPDNISCGSDGLIWVAIASPENGLATRIRRGPQWLRRAADKIPTRLQPQPARSVRVTAYDDQGTLVHDLDLPSDGYAFVTGVREHHGRVWLSSLHEPALAYVDL
jgi:sugar lactone lactonase YvrE